MTAPSPTTAIIDCLREHRLTTLFIDVLGWDRATGTTTFSVEGWPLTFTAIAHKRGLRVLQCQTDRLVLMNRELLRRLQRRIARTTHEHVLIFTCEQPRKQVWAWAIHLPDGRKQRHREHPFFSASPPEPLLARLNHLQFDLQEEETVTLVDALDRTRKMLDAAPDCKLFARSPRIAQRSDELARAMKRGEPGAFHKFVLFHCRLARSRSRILAARYGMEVEDAEQIGVIGLMEAARRFDPELGFQFSTYASWWIRVICQRSEGKQLIRVPGYLLGSLWQHAREAEQLSLTAGPSAIRDQVAEMEMVNPQFARCWHAYLRTGNVESLSDRPVKRQGQAIPDNLPPPIERLARLDTAAKVREVLRWLRPRDALIIRLRYGLDGKAHTLDEIGQHVNLSKERIRQIERRAVEKLRRLLQNEDPLLETTSVPDEEQGDSLPQNPVMTGASPLRPGPGSPRISRKLSRKILDKSWICHKI